MRPNLKTLSIKEQIQGIERTPQPIKTPFNGIMVKDKEGSLHYLILSKITKILARNPIHHEVWVGSSLREKIDFKNIRG